MYATPAPGPGEVRLRHSAIGINYIDVYMRSGAYRIITPPAPIGVEAAGVVLDVGEGVARLLPGDRVAYACMPPGAYVGTRTMSAEQLVVLPDTVDDENADQEKQQAAEDERRAEQQDVSGENREDAWQIGACLRTF